MKLYIYDIELKMRKRIFSLKKKQISIHKKHSSKVSFDSKHSAKRHNDEHGDDSDDDGGGDDDFEMSFFCNGDGVCIFVLLVMVR